MDPRRAFSTKRILTINSGVKPMSKASHVLTTSGSETARSTQSYGRIGATLQASRQEAKRHEWWVNAADLGRGPRHGDRVLFVRRLRAPDDPTAFYGSVSGGWDDGLKLCADDNGGDFQFSEVVVLAVLRGTFVDHDVHSWTGLGN